MTDTVWGGTYGILGQVEWEIILQTHINSLIDLDPNGRPNAFKFDID